MGWQDLGQLTYFFRLLLAEIYSRDNHPSQRLFSKHSFAGVIVPGVKVGVIKGGRPWGKAITLS
jgi:hypothetical protein